MAAGVVVVGATLGAGAGAGYSAFLAPSGQTTYLVAVSMDGNNLDARTKRLSDLLAAMGGAQRIGSAWAWMVHTSLSPSDLNANIQKTVDADKVFVTEIGANDERDGWLNSSEWRWLRDRDQ